MYARALWHCFKSKKGPACCSPRGHHRRYLSRFRLSSSQRPFPEKPTKFSAIMFALYVSICFVQILRSIVRAYHKYSRTISMAWRCRERMFLCRHGALCQTFSTFPWDSQRIGVTHNKCAKSYKSCVRLWGSTLTGKFKEISPACILFDTCLGRTMVRIR